MSDQQIRVLIVDDHPIVRQGMEMLLSGQPDMEVVELFEDGKSAVSYLTTNPNAADVVLMDLNMPNLNGIEATKQLRENGSEAQVIVLTSHHEDAMVFPAIKAGALSYLLKSATPDEVLDAVRAAAKGESRLHPRVAQRLMDEVSGRQNSPDVLTNRELEVLKEIASGKDNRTIAADLILSEKTVKTHISNILGKLGLTDRTQAAIYALKEGIVPLDN